MAKNGCDNGTIEPLLADKNIQFVFVGGKGGVGKTTSSCAVALQLAKRRKGNVLLISTDPAHNLSDALMQQFDGTPQKVKGTQNLFAMETDPDHVLHSELEDNKELAGIGDEMMADFKQWVSSVPGIDEAMALATVLSHVESGKFDVIVFDTAPTGHTLRLLQLPAVLKIGLDKLNGWKAKLGTVLSSVTSVLYQEEDSQAAALAKLNEKMQYYHGAVSKINTIFRDNTRTQFVCVCIAEHLSVFETRRLVSELAAAHIACRYILVNQLVPTALASVSPDTGGAGGVATVLSRSGVSAAAAAAVKEAVELCGARARIQAKYLKELKGGLSSAYVTVQLPLLPAEVRGVPNLSAFSERLLRLDPKLAAPGSDGASSVGDEWSSLMEVAAEGKEGGSEYAAKTAAKFMNKTADAGDGAEIAPAICVGASVRLVGLKSAAFNGKTGTVVNFNAKKQRWGVNVPRGKKRKVMMLKPENLEVVAAAASSSEGPAIAEAVTPEMMKMVQQMVMRPGGVQRLLSHAHMTALKAQDKEVAAFCSDVAAGGLMGAFKYLGNNNVMSKLATVARRINEEDTG